MNANGFPRMKKNKDTGEKEPQKAREPKPVEGFQTGDIELIPLREVKTKVLVSGAIIYVETVSLH